jgi:glutaredoxin
MSKLLILFTMKGCPFCDVMKEQLKEEKIKFYDRDIDEHSDEYDLFVEITENDYVPAFMIVEDTGKEEAPLLFAPDRDFTGIEHGVEIIKEHFGK